MTPRETPTTPDYTPDALELVERLNIAFRERLVDDAADCARREHLNAVSERHVEEAFRALLPNYDRMTRWWTFADSIAGVVGGAALGVLYTEFAKPNRQEWNVELMVICIAIAMVFPVVIAIAKLRS